MNGEFPQHACVAGIFLIDGREHPCMKGIGWYASCMTKQPFEMREGGEPHQPEERGAYDRYQELGGIINEQDFADTLARAGEIETFKQTLVWQAEGIAAHAGIDLEGERGPDPRVKLYAVLRTDTKPEDVEHHHSQMSDQRLFAEVLRMLGDAESLDKIIAAYPNISF